MQSVTVSQVTPDTRYSQHDLSPSYCETSKFNTRFRFRSRYPTDMARMSAPKIRCQSRFGHQQQPLARHRLVAYSPRVNYDLVAELCPSDSECGYYHAQSGVITLYVPPADIYPTENEIDVLTARSKNFNLVQNWNRYSKPNALRANSISICGVRMYTLTHVGLATLADQLSWRMTSVKVFGISSVRAKKQGSACHRKSNHGNAVTCFPMRLRCARN